MNWNLIDQYHIKSGPWTITKPANMQGIPKPYGLYFDRKLIRHVETSQQAKEEAEHLTVTQI